MRAPSLSGNRGNIVQNGGWVNSRIYILDKCDDMPKECKGQGSAEMVLVPREPTEAMLRAAADDALAEDAKGVWKSMVAEWLQSSGKPDSGSA